MPFDVAAVFGTYNRLALLQRCIESLRSARGSLSLRLCIVDGGSTDGTLAYLREQPDVTLIEHGALLGAVRAFNDGFAAAVDLEAPYVVQFNDDIAFVSGGGELERAAAILHATPTVGCVAFNSDRYGEWRFERVHGVPYANQGMFRRDAGMAAARAMGDPTGKAWWDRRFHTYASDTILGCWLWRLGWTIHEAVDLRVHEHFNTPEGKEDPLRIANVNKYVTDPVTKSLFWQEWATPASVAYSRAAAEAYGGLLR